MTEQLRLNFEAPPARFQPDAATAPRCSFGSYSVGADGRAPGYYGEDHCGDCHANTLAAYAAFDAAVTAGTFNRRGYTRAEWKRAGRPAEGWAA